MDRLVLGVLIVLCVATIAGTLRGGSVLRIADLPVRGLLPAGVAGALQVVVALFLVPGAGWVAPAAVVASNCLVGACLVLNRKMPGVALAAIGLAMNATVTLLNGAMPVAPAAAEIARLDPGGGANLDAEHVLMTDETLLGPLGDVIPIPGGHLVISVGDVLLAAGLALFVYGGMQPRQANGSTPNTYNVTVAMGGGET